jgi:cob(I)alamin adenosyltransferase
MKSMCPFFTRTGDDGYTSLLGEGRVPKYHPRPDACGALDEASAAIGVARSLLNDPVWDQMLLLVQRHLYQIMAEVAATPENASRFRSLTNEQVSKLETFTETISQQVEIPKEFIVPGDTQPSAMLALARTITRRAERQVARLAHSGEIDNPAILAYLNRLSSLLFILEIAENTRAGNQKPTFAKETPE